MNIAIVDDEPVFLKQLHDRLREMKIPDCEIHEIEDFLDEQAEIFKITEYRAVKVGG